MPFKRPESHRGVFYAALILAAPLRHFIRFRSMLAPMIILWTTLLLIGSNLFMTYAWYGHLRDFKDKPLWFVIILSWVVALFEYCLQVPANRIGFQQAGLSLQQLKVLQEILTMSVFAAFAVVYMKERLSINFVYASLCMAAAAWFMFSDMKHPT